jgi:hypothetical protein
MTRNYNRSEIFNYYDLSPELQKQVKNDFLDELIDLDSFQFVVSEFKGEKTAIPLGMFMRADSNFTHGIYSDSYFSGYFVTLSRCNTEAVIAYKYF